MGPAVGPGDGVRIVSQLGGEIQVVDHDSDETDRLLLDCVDDAKSELERLTRELVDHFRLGLRRLDLGGGEGL
jgi:hypothetical protein